MTIQTQIHALLVKLDAMEQYMKQKCEGLMASNVPNAGDFGQLRIH